MNALPEVRVAALPGGALSYREAGRGSTVLLLHGLNGSSKSWGPQFNTLGRRHRVIAWDAPGYGKSAIIDASIDAYADAAAGLMDALAAEPGTVVGHSMGGVVAARLAHRRPDLVRRLVLSCTHWGLALPAASPLEPRYVRRIEARRSLPTAEYGRTRAKNMLAPGAAPQVAATVAAIAEEVTVEGLEGAIRMEHSADNRPMLATLSIPILLIDADRDPVLPPERADALAAFLPTARRVTLAGSGHAPYLEDVAGFNRAVEEFLEP